MTEAQTANIQQFFTLLAQGLLVIAIPILVAYAGQWIRQWLADVRSRMPARQQALVDGVIGTVVRAAEQQGLTGELKSGGAKREFAVQMATDFLARYGVGDLDVGEIVTLIEAEVHNQFNSAATPPDTAEARSALIDKAVNVAVDAAQQSGITGVIQNVGAHKKQYALDFASSYLAEHGIRVAGEVISGLIEAQIMHLKRESAAAPSVGTSG